MDKRVKLIERLEQEPQDDTVRRLTKSLRADSTQLLEGRVKVSVGEALRVWSTRLKNVEITECPLPGAEQFVSKLSTMAKQRKLEQFALVNGEMTANLFFTGEHKLVGAIVIDR